jgi:hypothetical protein
VGNLDICLENEEKQKTSVAPQKGLTGYTQNIKREVPTILQYSVFNDKDKLIFLIIYFWEQWAV